MNNLRELMSLLLTTTSENVADTGAAIIKSDWIKYQREVRQLTHSILEVVKTRPNQIRIMADLTVYLRSMKSPENLLGCVKENVFSSIMKNLRTGDAFPNASGQLTYLYYCYARGMYTDQMIIKALKSFPKKDFRDSFMWLFAYFVPEIDIANHQLCQKLWASLRKTSGIARPNFFLLHNSKEHLKQEKWHQLKSARTQNNGVIRSAIASDDIEWLRQKTQDPNFNINQRLETSIYEPSAMLQGRPTLIQVAAFYGSEKCFKFLMGHGADLNLFDEQFNTVCSFAVAGGNMGIIRICQQEGLDFAGTALVASRFHRPALIEWLSKDINEVNQWGHTLAHAAAEANDVSTLSYVMRRNGNLDVVSLDGSTPLKCAVDAGATDAVKFLLRKGADVTHTFENGMCYLHAAARHGHLPIFQSLMKEGIPINTLSNTRSNALHYAVRNGQIKMIEYLLTVEELDVNHKARGGFTPLHIAVIGRSPTVLKTLLSSPRIKLNIHGKGRYTPLGIAINSSIMTTILLKQPALFPNKITVNKAPAVTSAIRLGHQKVVQAFINCERVSLNTRDKVNRDTPLIMAVKGNRIEILKDLIESGRANPNLTNKKRFSALHIACAFDLKEAAWLLIMWDKVNVNLPGPHQLTPLHMAAHAGLPDLVLALLMRDDLNVNAVDDRGHTALHYASKHDNPEMIEKFLIRDDLDKSIKDTFGLTPYDYAGLMHPESTINKMIAP